MTGGLWIGPSLGIGSVSIGASVPAVGPLNAFTIDLDFVNDIYKGAPQTTTLGNRSGDALQDAQNSAAAFAIDPNTATPVKATNPLGLRRTGYGIWAVRGITNSCLWCRDLTNAAWTKTGSPTVLKDQVSTNGVANTASSILAGAANDRVSQTITRASGDSSLSIWLKRLLGTGTIRVSQDGGTTWNDVTASLTTLWKRFKIEGQVLTNPSIIIEVQTIGDKIAVDFVKSEPRKYITGTEIATTTAAVGLGRSRPAALSSASSPLVPIALGAHAWYWEGSSEMTVVGVSPDALNLWTSGSDGYIANVSSDGTNEVQYLFPASASANGSWKIGLLNINKVAGYVAPDGSYAFCINGGSVVKGTGFTPLPKTFDHYDIGCNGAGQVNLDGPIRRYSIGPNKIISDADLVTMTT